MSGVEPTLATDRLPSLSPEQQAGLRRRRYRRLTSLLLVSFTLGWLLSLVVAARSDHLWLPLPWGLGLTLMVAWHRGFRLGTLAMLVCVGLLTLNIWERGRPFAETWPELLSLALASLLGMSWLENCRGSWIDERTLARRDFLTRVGNRHALMEALTAEMGRLSRNGRPFAVALLDCDGFKQLNDTYGHARGDEALVRLAYTLKRNVRAYDTVARLGGDEFVVILSEAEPDVAEHVMERLQTQLRFALERDFPRLSVTMGVVVFRKSPPTVDDCIREADAVMYRTRKVGRARTEIEVYDPETSHVPWSVTESAPDSA